MKSNDRMLRFMVDEYVPLKPDLKHGNEFTGGCPKTGKSHGLIVNEYKETIELPLLKKIYFGRQGLGNFLAEMKLEFRRKSVPKVTELKAKRVNDRLWNISKKILKDCSLLIERNKVVQRRFTDLEFEVEIRFYFSKRHRLYHPNSDNILCGYRESVRSKMLLDKNDITDRPSFRSFPHCWLFHSLTEHKGVPVEDLLYLDFIWVDYESVFQRKLKGLMK